MTKITRIDIPTKPGETRNAAIMLPLKGPFVTLPQHEIFERDMNWDQFIFQYYLNSSHTFDLLPGYAVYQQGTGGKITVAGYDYDTSD